jgi:hypothetical protein
MAEILGLGVTHYPGLMYPDAQMSVFLQRTLESRRVPEARKDPASWPEPMRREWSTDQGTAAAAEHRRRCVEAFRAVRKELDAFAPDFVVIWGDDQYENFREEIVPPFCVYATPELECRPFARKRAFTMPENVWGEPSETVFTLKGHPAGARYLAGELITAHVDMPYAYTTRYEFGLAHAFINTVLYLDWDRTGFPYPVVPFHVNCYGSVVIQRRGGGADPVSPEPDPPGPPPARCFDVGAAGGAGGAGAFTNPAGNMLQSIGTTAAAANAKPAAGRTIAGVAARCFEFSEQGQGSGVACIGPDGQLLAVESTTPQGVFKLTATKLESKPAASDFEPPYPVTAFPGFGGGIPTPPPRP